MILEQLVFGILVVAVVVLLRSFLLVMAGVAGGDAVLVRCFRRLTGAGCSGWCSPVLRCRRAAARAAHRTAAHRSGDPGTALIGRCEQPQEQAMSYYDSDARRTSRGNGLSAVGRAQIDAGLRAICNASMDIWPADWH